MSACLFTLSAKWFEKSSIEEITQCLEVWKKVIGEFETDSTKHGNRFESDRYSGYMDNVGHATWYLAGYDRAKK